ncbi:hypothetical protein J5N58_06895 [Rhizobium cremeum]|uniref:hypothetical protein n=1 Tax=Rhizobium cremeum TaxID=2813827 RepID=UPI001FD22E98|nr:hypothetical protein [Rhizobium cremeum]MCJ7996678.1 hypothetical protein [Rhizobium cremeum]MCJ7999402.1 hypothetical protein [Rhizobium cremeum]
MEASVTKGEFAALIGVSPGRVSQYLTEGKISQAALVGSGRNAKIRVEQAKADLRLTLDVSQRLGNGIDTQIDAGGQPVIVDGNAAGTVVPPPLQQSGIDYEIKQQKLEAARRANRNAAINEARERGQLMDTDAGRAEMTRVASALMDVFDGGLSDMATAIAAEFQLPQRDVKHILRKEFRKLRETAAKQMKTKAVSVPEYSEVVIEAEEADPAELA